jgi:hypothetical protein
MNFSATDYVFLTLLFLMLLLALALALLVNRLVTGQRELMTGLLMQQVQENQSLRNQLRSSDPQTLLSLQYATGVPSPSNDEEEPPLHYQEGQAYVERDVEAGELDDELAASGWSEPDGSDGGSPIVFGR